MQRYIYIRSTETIIPCTEEEFQEYYRGINAFRKFAPRGLQLRRLCKAGILRAFRRFAHQPHGHYRDEPALEKKRQKQVRRP